METDSATPQVVVLSEGMGVESVGILLRWMEEPETCPCRLEDLVVITAQVGNEFRDTGEMMEQHILPRMRAKKIRYVQVARRGHLESDGITVLSDTSAPDRMYLDGDYKLSDELQTNGTVPQFAGGVHRCALKFKAFVIETWLREHLCGASIRHAIGYNAQETSRIENSEYAFEERRKKTTVRVAFGFNTDELTRIERASEYDGLRGDSSLDSDAILNRVAFYPLLEWGWNRQHCIDYIYSVLGVTWRKSCCVFCPFAANKQNVSELAVRHMQHPMQVADAMTMEHVSLAMNPRGTLYRDKSLIQITIAQGNTKAVESYEKKVSETPWALYRVRRIYHAQKSNPAKKGTADRAVEKVDVFADSYSAKIRLEEVAAAVRGEIEEQRGIQYVYRERCATEFPCREEFFTVAPAMVETKARYGIDWFDEQWSARQASLF